MKAEETSLKNCWVLEPNVFEDERGFFYEGFNSEKFKKLTGNDFVVRQLNQSQSLKGVLRGLHFQNQPKAQAKLVTCVDGEVLDVAVDLRKNSPTYKKHFSIELTAENKKHLYIPKGFAHGFLVLSESAKLMYQVDELYSAEHDTGIAYDDPEIGIDWRIPKSEIILSNKDATLKKIEDSVIDL